MSIGIKQLLKNKVINGWSLFWLISIPICIVITFEMINTDLSTGSGISHMIGYSVRWAIPFIYIVVGTSSLQILFPGYFTAWLMRNRKYIGLCFAVGMAWQGLFIFIVSTFMRDYYFKDIYFFRDELEGSVGYIFLVAMVVTSFRFGRKFVNPMQWKLVHKGGVYFLWSYPFSVYWWAMSGAEPRVIDYIFYWTGLLVFLLRIAAWGKKRQALKERNKSKHSTTLIYKVLGSVLISFGFFASATSYYWQKNITETLTASPWSAELELWLPFWPLEPFIPLLITALGTLFLTKRSRNQ